MNFRRGMTIQALGFGREPASPVADAVFTRRGVHLASFHDAASAGALVRLLNEEGFETWLDDGRKHGGFWFLESPPEGVYVCVAPESARRCLMKLQHDRNLSANAIRCPCCDSLRLEYRAATEKNIGGAVCGTLLALAGIRPREFHCQDCQCNWV